MVHDNRIFLIGIEISWLHHPTVQFYTIASSESEELLARHVEVGYLFCQSLVVHKRSQCLTRIVIDSNDWRRCDIGECIDVILHALAEDGTVGTFICRKFGFASLGIDLVNMLKKVSRGLSRVEAGNPGFLRLVQVTSGGFSWWL